MTNSAKYIAVSGLVRVLSTEIPDESKPHSLITRCDFLFRDEKVGYVTIPVCKSADCLGMHIPDSYLDHYCSDRNLLVDNSIFLCSGEYYFPPGDNEEYVKATQMDLVAGPDQAESLTLGSPSIYALGTIASAKGEDWVLDVGIYDVAVSDLNTAVMMHY
jgi:hypothetical protein